MILNGRDDDTLSFSAFFSTFFFRGLLSCLSTGCSCFSLSSSISGSSSMRISSFTDSSCAGSSSSIISASTMDVSRASGASLGTGSGFLRSCRSSNLSMALSMSASMVVSLLTDLELELDCWIRSISSDLLPVTRNPFSLHNILSSETFMPSRTSESTLANLPLQVKRGEAAFNTSLCWVGD